MPVIEGDGSFSTDVVGESHYQRELEKVCGRRNKEGHDRIVEAALVPEDDNPYDRNAVAVRIHGMTVGYLSRHDAPKFRAAFVRDARQGDQFLCRARIRGGWWRGPKDQGSFGVRLDIPLWGRSAPATKHRPEEVFVAPAPAQPVSWVGLTLGIGCLSVFGFCILSMLIGWLRTGSETSSKTHNPESEYILTGQFGKLHMPGAASVFIATDNDSWKEMIKYQTAKDTEGLGLLLWNGKILRIDNGARVKAVNRSLTAVRVRVEEGPKLGREGWVQIELVKPEN